MSERPQTSEPISRSRALIAFTSALVFAPIAADLGLSGPGRPFAYVAADYFYYATVARNVVKLGSVSFDGSRAINGFHPLWQGILSALYGVVSGLGGSDLLFIYASVLLCAALMTAAVALFGLAFQRGQALSPLFLLLPVGAYGFALSPVWWSWGIEGMSRLYRTSSGGLPLFGTLWSFVNGMESAVLIALVALATYRLVSGPVETPRSGALLGVILALAALARLDHAVFPVALLGALGLDARFTRSRPRMKAVGIAALIVVGALGAYGLVNYVVFGSAVPVSGALKSDFPRVRAEGFPVVVEVLTKGRSYIPSVWYRVFPITVPTLLSALYVAWQSRSFRRLGQATPLSRLDTALYAIGWCTLIVGLYNFLFVALHHQGHWYCPIGTLFPSLLVLRFAAGPATRLLRSRARLAVAGVLSTAVVLVHFVVLQRKADYNQNYARFFLIEAPKVVAHYGDERPRLLCWDDGVVAFATGFPTMSVALALDPEGVRSLNDKRLGELALARGFDRFTSFDYLNLSQPLSPRLTRQIGESYGLPFPERYRFTTEYRSTSERFGIVRVEPADPR